MQKTVSMQSKNMNKMSLCVSLLKLKSVYQLRITTKIILLYQTQIFLMQGSKKINNKLISGFVELSVFFPLFNY